jgi:hypothetical protein
MIRRLAQIALPTLALLVAAAPANAYWPGTGTGSGSAGVGTLNPPTAVSANASPGSSTVAVTWTASSTAGSAVEPEGYYVTRATTSSPNTPLPACGSSSTSLITSATSCNDTSVADGSYTYTVTAVFRSWDAASAPSDQVTVQGDTTAPSLSQLQMRDVDVDGKVDRVVATFDEPIESSSDVTRWTLADAPGGATRNAVSTSGSTATLTLNEGTADTAVGSFKVTLAAGAGGIRDAAGNQASFSNGTPDDAAAPVVVSLDRTGASPTNASSAGWTALFSEPVSGVSDADFVKAAGAPASGSPSVTPVDGKTYTVTVGTITASGTLGVNLDDDDSIADPASNKLGGTGAGNGNFTGQTYTIDKTAPTSTLADPGTDLQGTVTVNATASDTSGVQTVALQRSPTGQNVWGPATAACNSMTAGTAPNYSCQLNTTLLTNGASYDFRVVAIDTLGNATVSAQVSNRRILNPAGTNIQGANGGTVNKLDQGDTVTFTYNRAMALSSFGLTGTTARDVKVRVVDNGNDDVLTVYDQSDTTQVPIGSVNLGGNYVTGSGNFVFGGNGGNASRLQADTTGTIFTLTIGKEPTVNTLTTTSRTLTWTPSAGALSAAPGNVPSLTTAVTEGGAADGDF